MLKILLNLLKTSNFRAFSKRFSLEKENSSTIEGLSEKILSGKTLDSSYISNSAKNTINTQKDSALHVNSSVNRNSAQNMNSAFNANAALNSFVNSSISSISAKNSSGSSSNALNQPKWMRFFAANEPMKIDLERSIKNENRDMIINYVKINYLSFDFQQLVLSLEKHLKIDLSLKLFHEIKLRIAVEAYQTNSSILLSLLNYSGEACRNDPLISRFLAVEFIKNFEEFQFLEQIHVMNFLLKINFLPKKTLADFLKNCKEWKDADGKLSAFSLKYLNELLAVVNELHHVMRSEKFELAFKANFREEIYKEVIFVLNKNQENRLFLLKR